MYIKLKNISKNLYLKLSIDRQFKIRYDIEISIGRVASRNINNMASF